jgi:hypothetical protein
MPHAPGQHPRLRFRQQLDTRRIGHEVARFLRIRAQVVEHRRQRST